MAKQKKNNAETREASAATVGYEAELWRMADALRGSMDAAEYKHVVPPGSPVRLCGVQNGAFDEE